MVIAMGVAGLINVAMLIMAASTFFTQGHTGVGTIEEAHRTLEPLLGTGRQLGLRRLAAGFRACPPPRWARWPAR